MSPLPLIEAEGISVARGGGRILDNVSLSIEDGDFVTVIGPNGAGKSTLLKALAGLLVPDSGRVARRPGLALGYIPQRIAIDASLPMTAERFLRLGRGRAGAGARDTVAEETGIAPLLGRPVQTLSGGEWQRVLLARALLGRPDAIILDEPAQNLDITGQLAFYALLERIHRDRGIAIAMVSHDLHMVMASTRRVVCLYHHVCCSGEPRAVARDPEFIRLFGRDMARMMAVYQHDHDHSHDHDGHDHHHGHGHGQGHA